MSLTVQTNIASLIAQTNLNLNSEFMTQTITRLTSGYRINSSADDAAGLVIANQYRSNIAELTQGIRNANDGVSTLQIVDGGLNNISTMLDRMKTLATESSSGTFSGNRATLDQEYQQLIGEITRQASNIGLNAGGSNNGVINVYIGGGGSVQANSQIKVDLSGSGNTVDATGLGVNGTTLLAPGSAFGSINLNAQSNLLTGGANGESQVLTFNLAGGSNFQVTVASTSTQGITVQNALSQLNSALSPHGLAASIDPTTGHLLIAGNVAFTASAAAAGGGSTGLVAAADVSSNGSDYQINSASGGVQTPFPGIGAGNEEILNFTSGTNSTSVTLTNANAGTTSAALATLNNALQGLGISAVLGTDGAGGAIEFQSANAFSVSKAQNAIGAGGVVGVLAATTGVNPAINDAATAPTITAGVTSNALTAITAINSAIAHLGNVQGTVGAGENKLNYAIGLATSQITSFSAAQSRIRDADMAAEAANLTKAQILQQSSVAAMAQANAAPQAVLALLK